jgi:hypothetical protein
MGMVVGYVALAFLWGTVCFVIGWRLAQRYRATWLVRPHTRRTLDRMPLPEDSQPTVSQAVFVRTNLPGSTSTMD